VTRPARPDADSADRARRWRNATQAAVCDVSVPWAHGTVVKATRYPSYYDYNVVRVEESPEISVEELIEVADEALAGLAHRRVDFDVVDAAGPLRSGFEARGWEATSLWWMRHERPLPPGAAIAVEEVDYDAVRDLRRTWHGEDFPGHDLGEHEREAREVALAREAQVLAVSEAGTPVAFAQLERGDASAEITQVYVHPDHRGKGRGTALTAAAVTAAGEVQDLWIVADAEDRPKQLYSRLGFRTAWTTIEFLRLP
jgi:ribosomal protein S18 acetylase RimI-like enzyme